MARVTHIGSQGRNRLSLMPAHTTLFWSAPSLTAPRAERRPGPVAGPYRSQSSNPKIRSEATAHEHRTIPSAPTSPAPLAPTGPSTAPHTPDLVSLLTNPFGTVRSALSGAGSALAIPTPPVVVPKPLEQKTLGSPSLEELLSGHLGLNAAGKITTPSTRLAARSLSDARSRLLRSALPSLAGLSAAERRILPFAEQAHKEYPDVPVSVLMAQDKQESGFNPLAESSAGAFGTSQFIPSTASSYGVQRGASPRAIQSQLSGQAHYLHDLGFSQSPQAALSSYSGGYAASAYNNPILTDAQTNYGQLDRPTRVPQPVRSQYRQAAIAARRLGIKAPTQQEALQPASSSSHFPAHVARELHLVKTGQYDKGAGTLVVDHGVSINQGHEPEIAARLKLLSAKLGVPVYIISGYRSPQHSVEVGGFANDPHTSGQAADIGIGSASRDSVASIPESAFESVGLHRPFYPESAAEVNHVQLLNGGSPATGGGAGSVGGFATGGAILASGGAAAATQALAAQQPQSAPISPLNSPFSAGPVMPDGYGGAESAPLSSVEELLALLHSGRRSSRVLA